VSGLAVPVLLGAVLGGSFAFAASFRGATVRLRLLAFGLLVAALIYPVWVLASRATDWLLLESAGVVLFGAIAWLGVRNSLWLVLGWAAHVGWDAGLHLDRQSVIPFWYPLLCVGFDLVVAGFLLGQSVGRERKTESSRL
jgi:hypothetical protein